MKSPLSRSTRRPWPALEPLDDLWQLAPGNRDPQQRTLYRPPRVEPAAIRQGSEHWEAGGKAQSRKCLDHRARPAVAHRLQRALAQGQAAAGRNPECSYPGPQGHSRRASAAARLFALRPPQVRDLRGWHVEDQRPPLWLLECAEPGNLRQPVDNPPGHTGREHPRRYQESAHAARTREGVHC